VSERIPDSKARFSRWAMIAMPWSPRAETITASPGRALAPDSSRPAAAHRRRWW
jgi:hypothetical protein